MEQLLLTFALITIFYLLIPGSGAFLVRSRWRGFRRQILATSLHRVVGYQQFRTASNVSDGGLIGNFRFMGKLEAIQGDDTMWLRNGNVTVAVEMKGVRVYTLFPVSQGQNGHPRNDEQFPDPAPQIQPWSRVGSLSEGTRFYVGGRLEVQHGIPTFRSTSARPLIVVIFDGPEESFLGRCIWSGRQRNEYWNQFTPASLLTGSFALLVVSYLFLRSPLLRLSVLFSLSLSAVPVLPLLPPGIVLFFLYRFWWRKARYFRAHRDLVRLPLRFFPERLDQRVGDRTALPELHAVLPDESGYCGRRASNAEAEAALNAGAVLRDVPELASSGRDSSCYIFNVCDPGAEAGLAPGPRDPLAEHVVYRQDPSLLAERCERKARSLELLAVAAFTICILLNGYGVFLALSNIVR
ncbi:MAG TPA: hypothetical protein VMW73_10310 [Spirochaetia bacterium]|nr:hypothetical protein [Spirochaetia bacterium]